MKRLTALVLVFSMVFALAACGSNTESTASSSTTSTGTTTAAATTPAEKSGNITVWTWDPNFNIPVMKAAADAYTKVNPNVKVNITEIAKADCEQKLHTNLASGVTEGLPEITLIEDYNAQKYLQSYPGQFADLTDKINYSDFAAYKTSLMTVDNKKYGVPFDSGVTGFFYRTDYLEQAGYKAADLNNITWDKFIEIGKQVKAKTGKAMLTFTKNDGGIMRTMMQSAGQWYFDDKGNVNMANNAVIQEAAQTYKNIVDAGIIKETSGWSEWVAGFNKGDVASVISGCWIIGSIKASADQSGKWALAPIPKLNATGATNASNLGGSSWYVLDKTKGRDLAIDFLKTEYDGNNDFYQGILTQNGAIGTYTPAQKGTAYETADTFFGGQKVYSELASWIPKIPAINYGLYTYEADAAIFAVMQDIYNGKPVVDTLKKAEEQLKNTIQK